MIALVSAKGSPGVTTTALALTLSSPGRCLLAECDPGGGDILTGYLQGCLPAGRGLAPLAVAQLRGRLPEEFDAHLVDLEAPRRQRLVLPGVADPAQATTVAAVWEPLAAYLRAWPDLDADDAGSRVVVDCGRLTGAHVGTPLLRHADRVLLVLRAHLPSVAAAVPAVRALGEQLADRPSGTLGLLVVEIGPYRPAEVADRLGVPLVASLPRDDRAAAALSFGGTVRSGAPLLRAAGRVHPRLAAPQVVTAVPTEVTGV